MNRRGALTFAVAGVLALAACGGDDSTAEGSDEPGTEPAATDEGSADGTDTGSTETGTTGSTGGDSAAEGSSGGTLYVNTQDTSIYFDPATSFHLPTTWLGLIGRRLTTWDLQPGEPPVVVPDLATDTGTPSDDGTTWTYTLKDGILFDDGTPVTSHDIKYAVERSFAPELSGGLAYHKFVLDGAETYEGPFGGEHLDSIETPDDKTIVFHLNTSYGDWPWIVSMPAFVPVPEARDDPATYGVAPAATGPYKVESNEDGIATTLVRNEFWDPATDPVRTAEPDSIVFLQSQNPATVVQTLIADEGDARNSIHSEPLGAAELALIAGNPDAQERLVTSAEGSSLSYMAINTERVTDPLVRQAIQYAVDRQAFIIGQGGAQTASPATTLITPGIPGRVEFDLYPAGDTGDADKAQELLAEAGVEDLELTLWVTNDQSSQAQAEAVQQGLQRAGITVNIQPLDPTTMYTDATASETPEFDLLLSWWLPDFPSAVGNIHPLFDSSQVGNGGFNLSRYANPEVDEMIAQAIAEVDPAAARALWAEIDQRIMQDAPVVPLSYTKQSFLVGSNVQNHFIPSYPGYQNYLILSLAQ